MFTFFGQFFDHGLDLVNKGGNGTVFVPLQPDDPLFTPGGANFMMLTRATLPGRRPAHADTPEPINQTTPFVDQNQTYTSHPSHQAFLREYVLDAGGRPRSTGKMIDGAGGNIGNWARGQGAGRCHARRPACRHGREQRAAACDRPLRLPRGVTPHGFPMAMLADGVTAVALNPAAPISSSLLAKTNHQFLNDIAHSAAPTAGVLTPTRRSARAWTRRSPQGATTTSCSTSTSSPATAAATRTSR